MGHDERHLGRCQVIAALLAVMATSACKGMLGIQDVQLGDCTVDQDCDGGTCISYRCVPDICGGFSTNQPGCNACLTSACCPEFQACGNDFDCTYCISSPMSVECSSNALYSAVTQCSSSYCSGC
jgi:hypothetical protein